MTFSRLVLRNLFYHWRGNIAVLMGVVVGTAVLTGALLVGDSLRGSLRELAAQQLGQVDRVLVGGRLLRQELAEELMADGAARRVVPALVLQGAITIEGSAESTGRGTSGERRAGRVTILGVGPEFWNLWPEGGPPVSRDFWMSAKRQVVLSETLARELKVGSGAAVRLHLQKVSAVPRESILGRKEASDVLDEIKLTCAAVLTEEVPGSRFNLNPSPGTARNVFVPLAALQHELVQEKPNQPRLQLRRPVNALLVEGGTAHLQHSLAKHLTLDDWGLVLRTPDSRARTFFKNLRPNQDGVVRSARWPRLRDQRFATAIGAPKGMLKQAALIAYYRQHHGYLSLESRQLFLENAAARAAQKAARKTGLTAAPTLVYLADKIAAGRRRVMNYAVVAALDPSLPPPLGPFLPKKVKRLKDQEIVLTDWKGTPIPPDSGVNKVELTYFDAEQQDRPHTRALKVRGWIALQGAADDPDLTPEFPGITDQPSLENWDPPESLHYEKKRVTQADEDYWQAYRTTPKAYVNLATGRKLWGSRFGELTSVRLAPAGGGNWPDQTSLTHAAKAFKAQLRKDLDPRQGGLVFDAVRQRALDASAGSNDFSVLFLSFSVFIIVAALLLVGLLFRLNLDRRAPEIGLLLASGIRRGTVRRLLLTEGSLLALVGGLVGLAGAVLYAHLLLDYLRSWWPGGLDRSFLRFDDTPLSYLIGYGASLLVSMATIAWAARVLGRVSPRALLAGETTEAVAVGGRGRTPRWRIWVGSLCLVGALACVAAGNLVSDHELRATTFFSSGFLLLVAGLIGVWSLLRREEVSPSRHVGTLGVRNASRHPVRSLLTVGLLASATFLIIAVQSFHRDPGKDFSAKDGGSGGFTLLGEAEVPLFLDWHTRRGRDELEYNLKLARVPTDQQRVLKKVSFYSFRLRAGDDTSCLNLAQPRRPRLLGVGEAFVQYGGFRFQDSEAASDRERANPWLLLNQQRRDGAVPVIADATTATWMLKKGLGKELEVLNENGQPVKLRLVALLQDSIFQSELLVSDANFRRLYPHLGGYQFFLIDAPAGQTAEVKTVLERALADHGLTIMPTYQRLETYLAVENTYLSTFQALGGLGLLLGALGLAVVLLRSVWERRGELALLRALGYRRSTLGWLVLAENSFLLALGVGVGAVTALVAVAPHVLGGAGEVPWLKLLGLLALVLGVGLAAGAAAVASTLRAPLVPALRRE